jgi:N-acetylmuramoyl-L-alanine amidase
MKRMRNVFKRVSLLVFFSLVAVSPLNSAFAEDTGQEEAAQAIKPEASPTPSEFRGLWITRFEWPAENPEKCKQNIVEVFKDMEEGNFNAAVFQIRGEAEVLYPSTLEPWSPLIGGKDPGFDPLDMAIYEAHKRGIQFHAYINPIPLCSWNRGAPPPHSVPEHLFYLHGPDSPEPWVCMHENGKIMDAARAGYYYLSPGIPEVQAYLRNVIMDVVHRYDVDGIHLDRIRYPGPQYSHDPVSKRRFLGRGNPNRKEWADWEREQLDKFINDLYAEIVAEKPQVVLSCAAWGIYNRHNIDGYDKFSSGYHDYYQDTWEWVRLGAMDVLMPMIYWDIPDPKPNYDELMKDFVRGVGPNHLVGGQRMYGGAWKPEENIEEIKVTRKLGALGTVIFSYGSAKEKGAFSALKNAVYQDKASVPQLDWKVSPEYGIILGRVTDEEGQPLADAWVSLKYASEEPVSRRPGPRRVSSQTWTSSADGRFAFLKVKPDRAKLVVEYDGAQKVELDNIQVKPGEVKRINVALEGAKAAREKVFFHIFRPEDGSETEGEVVHLLGRTLPQNKVTVADKPVSVYGTGAFAADNIPVNLGENKIKITASDGKTTTTSYFTVFRREPRPRPAVTTVEVIEPSRDLVLLPGDVLEITARGPAGLHGYATCWGRRVKLPLTETFGENSEAGSNYLASYRIPAGFHAKASRVTIQMIEKEGFLGLCKKKITAESKATIEVWDSSRTRVGKTTAENSGITFGTHSVRLAGPYLSEVPKDTRFEIIGKQGGLYEIRLSKSLSGWISERDVTILPEGTPVPHSFFTYCGIDGDDKYDKLSIPIGNVVYAITPQNDPQNCLLVDVFDTHYAATWISHKSGAKVIGPVSGEQIEDDWVRLKVPLKCKQIWGYWGEKGDGGITIFIKRPPEIAGPPDSPVKGLLFAIEAGHGGPQNLGAIGLMGTKEKTINSNAVEHLQNALEKRGAKTILVRPGDSNPSLSQRVETAIKADADFYISLHANAAGSAGGFLRVSGTSTYYKYDHCQLPAKLVYDELLKLGWDEFGVVGNFNYYPLRNTRVPAILVEQAFMSNPYDEARLLEQEYQETQSEAIVKGMEAFLTRIKE